MLKPITYLTGLSLHFMPNGSAKIMIYNNLYSMFVRYTEFNATSIAGFHISFLTSLLNLIHKKIKTLLTNTKTIIVVTFWRRFKVSGTEVKPTNEIFSNMKKLTEKWSKQ